MIVIDSQRSLLQRSDDRLVYARKALLLSLLHHQTLKGRKCSRLVFLEPLSTLLLLLFVYRRAVQSDNMRSERAAGVNVDPKSVPIAASRKFVSKTDGLCSRFWGITMTWKAYYRSLYANQKHILHGLSELDFFFLHAICHIIILLHY